MSRYRGAVLRITRRLGELPGLTRKVLKEILVLVNTEIKLENRRNMQFV